MCLSVCYSTNRGVFPQLAERWEGLLMSLAYLLYDGLLFCIQLIVFGQLWLGTLLLLLIAVVPDS